MTHNLKEFRFDRYRLDVAERCLFRDGELISLTGKEFEMLEFLLESCGRLVTKEELVARVWPDTTVVESNLFQHVRSLRKKLGRRQDGGEFIINVHGRGYCFMAGTAVAEDTDIEPTSADKVEVEVPKTADPLAVEPQSEVVQQLRPKWPGRWRWIGALSVGVMLLVVFLLRDWTRSIQGRSEQLRPLDVVDSPTGGVGPRIVRMIPVGAEPADLQLTADGKRLYVAEFANQAVSLVDTVAGVVTKRISVEPKPVALASSTDGRSVYIAHLSGGLSVIDTATNVARRIAAINDSVLGLVVTPDGKGAYLAMGFLGLGKLDLKTEQFRIVSKMIYVQGLALARDGRTLYVSYQSGGRGGSSGHDAIGYFDTATDRFAGAITGLANVGGFMAVSPDGSRLIEDGGDACASPRYDHLGCPFVPGGILNVIDVRNNRYLRSVGVRGANPKYVVFSADGQLIVVATGSNMILMSNDLRVVSSLPSLSSGRVAFAHDGKLAYVPATTISSVAVVQMALTIRAVRLADRGDSDETFPVAIVNGPDFEATSVDPTTLRMGGEAVKHNQKGVLMASIEVVTGFEGNSLIVHFDRQAGTGLSQEIEGMTYAGMRVRGIVEGL